MTQSLDVVTTRRLVGGTVRDGLLKLPRGRVLIVAVQIAKRPPDLRDRMKVRSERKTRVLQTQGVRPALAVAGMVEDGVRIVEYVARSDLLVAVVPPVLDQRCVGDGVPSVQPRAASQKVTRVYSVVHEPRIHHRGATGARVVG